MPGQSLSLLNVYEVESEDGQTHHILAFLDTVRAGAEGIVARSIVGELEPSPQGGYDPARFALNPEFVEAFTAFMNEVAATSESVVEQARAVQSEWLYVIDPRHGVDASVEPAPSDLLGAFAVDETGQVVPGSFQYNRNHRWLDPDGGPSGLLADRPFYDWLHPDREK